MPKAHRRHPGRHVPPARRRTASAPLGGPICEVIAGPNCCKRLEHICRRVERHVIHGAQARRHARGAERRSPKAESGSRQCLLPRAGWGGRIMCAVADLIGYVLASMGAGTTVSAAAIHAPPCGLSSRSTKTPSVAALARRSKLAAGPDVYGLDAMGRPWSGSGR